MDISVVIPTFNRSNILRRCLDCLDSQAFPQDQFEVIVVDDGSSDDTRDVVEEFEKKKRMNLKYLYQKNQGQGDCSQQGD